MQNETINAIKMLGVDMINKAKSGHPGIVLGAAPMAYTLFTKHLSINVNNPNWANRDRFVLSAGHGSGLLYALLHLAGLVSIDDLKQFRQLNSKTPGHPEAGHTLGVDVTTGPLGQGIASSVGLAIGETYVREYFGEKIFNHYTYVLCGDGDLQEGVAQEAISLAGHLGLGKLIVLYDSNDIQLDGPVSMANSENSQMKYESMGWQYIKVADGTNVEEIDAAISKAKLETSKPTIIEVKTIIGLGTSAQGTCKYHGSPVGEAEANTLRKDLNWEYEPFCVPASAYEEFKSTIVCKGDKAYADWKKEVDAYKEKADDLRNFLSGKFPGFSYETFASDYNDATRNVAAKVMEFVSSKNKLMIGGSADLSRSAMVKGVDGQYSKTNHLGRNICYGVREHAMGAITNGLSLYGLKAFCSAFFVFSDYLKPALRMSALMNIPSMFFFSHDSIAVGEDGPTHQPIEQLIALRSIPNMNVIRPCDANETVFAIEEAYCSKTNPTSIIMSRQKLPTLANTSREGLAKGAYIISEASGKLDGVLLACGSEVSLALKAQEELKKDEIFVRVVSIPSWFLFDKQDEAYKKQVLPNNVKTLAIEMGSPYGWYKYTRNVYAIDRFGISAPANDVLNEFGFTTESLVKFYKNIK